MPKKLETTALGSREIRPNSGYSAQSSLSLLPPYPHISRPLCPSYKLPSHLSWGASRALFQVLRILDPHWFGGNPQEGPLSLRVISVSPSGMSSGPKVQDGEWFAHHSWDRKKAWAIACQTNKYLDGENTGSSDRQSRFIPSQSFPSFLPSFPSFPFPPFCDIYWPPMVC